MTELLFLRHHVVTLCCTVKMHKLISCSLEKLGKVEIFFQILFFYVNWTQHKIKWQTNNLTFINNTRQKLYFKKVLNLTRPIFGSWVIFVNWQVRSFQLLSFLFSFFREFSIGFVSILLRLEFSIGFVSILVCLMVCLEFSIV